MKGPIAIELNAEGVKRLAELRECGGVDTPFQELVLEVMSRVNSITLTNLCEMCFSLIDDFGDPEVALELIRNGAIKIERIGSLQ
jgi:hypothetical protein